MDWEKMAARMRALHPRVSIANDSPAWLKSGARIYGATLDGKYHGRPRCRTREGALKKAEQISARIYAGDIK